jgi:hypothetical protein
MLNFGVGRFAWGFSGLLPFVIFALCLGLPLMHRFLMYDVVASLGGFQDFCLLPFLRFACFFATDARIFNV